MRAFVCWHRFWWAAAPTPQSTTRLMMKSIVYGFCHHPHFWGYLRPWQWVTAKNLSVCNLWRITRKSARSTRIGAPCAKWFPVRRWFAAAPPFGSEPSLPSAPYPYREIVGTPQRREHDRTGTENDAMSDRNDDVQERLRAARAAFVLRVRRGLRGGECVTEAIRGKKGDGAEAPARIRERSLSDG